MATTTRTGRFPVGFRAGWSPWQQNLADLIAFARAERFAGIDVAARAPADLAQIVAAGLRLGSVDLPQAAELASPDAGKRKDAAARIAGYVRDAVTAAGGPLNFFTVMAPEDDARPRSENLAFAADGYGRLCAEIEALPGAGPGPGAGARSRIVLEGYPGGAPRYAILACTPADLRLVFERIPSPVLGVNYDPSHLIRMGIDHVRFLDEFIARVHHVHAKDCELLDDAAYDHGNLQPATASKPHGFGAWHWRYTLPGHGVARWTRIFATLASAGYAGMVSIELEDEHFNGREPGEKLGLLAARDYLQSV